MNSVINDVQKLVEEYRVVVDRNNATAKQFAERGLFDMAAMCVADNRLLIAFISRLNAILKEHATINP